MTHSAALFLDAHQRAQTPFADPGVRRRWTRSGKEAAITIAAVAVSFVVAMAALPPLPTPGNVAAGFLQDWFRTEGSPAPHHLCESNRAVADPRFILEQLLDQSQHHEFPHYVDVHVAEVRTASGSSDPQFTVTVTATAVVRSWEGWTFPAEIPVVREDGEFRVCFQADVSKP